MTRMATFAHGVRTWAGAKVSHHRFERRYGVHTDGTVDLAELDLDHDDRVDYVASPWHALDGVLDTGEVGPGDSFLDIGAGKGRVMLQAALGYDFDQVIGLEVSHELASVAASNLAAARHRLRCRATAMVVADAATQPVDDAVTVVFMFNPFLGDTFRRVIGNIDASQRRAPRHLRVIYRNPLHDEVLREHGFDRLRTHHASSSTLTHLYGRDA